MLNFNENGERNPDAAPRRRPGEEGEYDEDAWKSAPRFRGVNWHKTQRRWQVTGYRGGGQKSVNLGSFRLEESEKAGRAYDAWAKGVFGDKAVLNFNENGERNPDAAPRRRPGERTHGSLPHDIGG